MDINILLSNFENLSNLEVIAIKFAIAIGNYSPSLAKHLIPFLIPFSGVISAIFLFALLVATVSKKKIKDVLLVFFIGLPLLVSSFNLLSALDNYNITVKHINDYYEIASQINGVSFDSLKNGNMLLKNGMEPISKTTQKYPDDLVAYLPGSGIYAEVENDNGKAKVVACLRTDMSEINIP